MKCIVCGFYKKGQYHSSVPLLNIMQAETACKMCNTQSITVSHSNLHRYYQCTNIMQWCNYGLFTMHTPPTLHALSLTHFRSPSQDVHSKCCKMNSDFFFLCKESDGALSRRTCWRDIQCHLVRKKNPPLKSAALFQLLLFTHQKSRLSLRVTGF